MGWLVRRWVASRTDLSLKGREQYQWALPHVERHLGGVRLDRLDREDVARWLEDLASGGELSRRSVEVCRNVLKAALADAVDEGVLRRSPAARVPVPREVAKAPLVKETYAWTEDEVARFLEAVSTHRLAVGFRLGVLYGLRRSELLALRWNDVDWERGSVKVDEAVVPVKGGVAWTKGKTARSRRVIPLDAETVRALSAWRARQAQERLSAGPGWAGHDFILSTRNGEAVVPRSFDRALDVVIRKAGLPRLSSHGLRHTAATHMVRHADNVGELRAVADVLGHSPDLLLRVYAHTLPESSRAVTEKIGRRGSAR